ncbi:MAG: hypothetical protein MK142_16445 [Pseudomonadales bacterium]|nr:hypothetical protein [Pseudomonadales bacterium]
MLPLGAQVGQRYPGGLCRDWPGQVFELDAPVRGDQPVRQDAVQERRYEA